MTFKLVCVKLQEANVDSHKSHFRQGFLPSGSADGTLGVNGPVWLKQILGLSGQKQEWLKTKSGKLQTAGE